MLCGESPMTMARAHLVDPAVTRWYHCVTRCVRRAFVLGEGPDDRKGWIETRLEELAELAGCASSRRLRRGSAARPPRGGRLPGDVRKDVLPGSHRCST